MEQQSQIKQRLSQQGSIEAIRRLLDGDVHPNRSSLAEAVCQQFGFFDARQRAQTAGCVKALRELERAGHFVLPAVGAGGRGIGKTARRLGVPVDLALGVPAQAGDVRGLTLVKVNTVEAMRVWNEMMLCEHPQGAGPLVGAQMRYLIGSEHGWLGGFGFGAAALQLRDRDQWIGWGRGHATAARAPCGGHESIPHSAIGALSQPGLARAGDGIAQHRCGFRDPVWIPPLAGGELRGHRACHRDVLSGRQLGDREAIGHSQGRGRQDRRHENSKSIKTIYVYALEADLRTRMGVAEPIHVDPVALGIAEGLDGAEWANNEFGGANLGDQRLNERLVDSARTLAAMPGRAFCGVAQGDVAAVKGYYRLIDKPDDSQLTMQAILAPHRQRTVQRMSAQTTVLCIQDGTDLNYSGLAQCQGLGSIGTNQTGARSPGLHLHSTLVVNTEGLPLGVLGAQCAAPTPKPKDDDRPACAIPIEEKKTFAWESRGCATASRWPTNCPIRGWSA